MKIKQDSHGLYLCVDGNLYRPEHSVYTIDKGSVNLGRSEMRGGDPVVAQRVARSPFITVIGADVSEFWCSHGPVQTSLNQRIPHEEVWRPADDLTPQSEARPESENKETVTIEDRMSNLADFLSKTYDGVPDLNASLMLVADVMRHMEQTGLDPKTILKMAEGFYDAENETLGYVSTDFDFGRKQ